MSFLGRDFAAVFASRFRGRVRKMTLETVTPGTPTMGALTDGSNPTTTTHKCEGAVIGYVDDEVDGDRVQDSDRKIIIFANTIDPPVTLPRGKPLPGYRIVTDEGPFTIIEIDSDPASATYTLQGR